MPERSPGAAIFTGRRQEYKARARPHSRLERRADSLRGQRRLHLAISTALLMGMWVSLSGHYEPFYVCFGLLSVGIVVYFSRGLMGSVIYKGDGTRAQSFLTLEPWHRMVTYLPWLLLAIVRANLQVAWIVLHPRPPINPVIIRFSAPLPSDVAQVTLAQSITLTPGTVTIDLDGNNYTVHALTPDSAEDLLNGTMQAKVEKAFGRAGWSKTSSYIAAILSSTQDVKGDLGRR